MFSLRDQLFEQAALGYQPWLPKSEAELATQREVQDVLRRRAGATFGNDCYVAEEARVFTHSLSLGDRSWIAAGAIIRGNVEFASDCSVNPYAHIAGKVKFGRGCRIASLVSIYGFNHGFSRIDVMIKDQPLTSVGVVLGEDVWVGANAIILDGVQIGAHCIVAAGAVVTGSFPPFKIIGGNPAKIIGDRMALSGAENSKNVAPETTKRKLRQLLFANDPYLNMKKSYPWDDQGWGSSEPIFREVIAEVRPDLIVEVGSWKGASAIHMAECSRENGLDPEIVCVDTWLGNWQHWSRETGIGSREDLKLSNGYPMLYFQFLSNVKMAGFADMITPLPLTSIGAAKLLGHHAMKADLIYIDGDHDYEGINVDLDAWLELLSERGVLLGDDYDWPGVRRAVDEVVAGGKWAPEIRGNKFVLRRTEPRLYVPK